MRIRLTRKFTAVAMAAVLFAGAGVGLATDWVCPQYFVTEISDEVWLYDVIFVDDTVTDPCANPYDDGPYTASAGLDAPVDCLGGCGKLGGLRIAKSKTPAQPMEKNPGATQDAPKPAAKEAVKHPGGVRLGRKYAEDHVCKKRHPQATEVGVFFVEFDSKRQPKTRIAAKLFLFHVKEFTQKGKKHPALIAGSGVEIQKAVSSPIEYRTIGAADVEAGANGSYLVKLGDASFRVNTTEK